MLPWAIWTAIVSAISLTLFVAVRGRWGGEAPLLVAAALVGTVLGNFLAGLLEIDLGVLGEYHLLGAAIGAQLAMIATSAVVTLFAGRPRSAGGRRDGAGSGQ
jgi:hypothetical protein